MPKKNQPNRKEILHNLVYSKNKKQVFLEIPQEQKAEILLNLSPYLQKQILNDLSNKDILDFINFLDPDQATDLLQKLTKKRRNSISKYLGESIKDKVNLLLKFNPQTAAGLMDVNYIQIKSSDKSKTIFELTQRHEKRTGQFPAILVVEKNKVLGELPGHALALLAKTKKLENHIKKVPTVKYNTSEKEVIKKFKSNPHQKVVVTDENGGVLGIIYAQDVLSIIEKKSSQTLYTFAGVNKEEDILDPSKIKISNRYRWLILNLGTAFLAASVVSFFQGTIEKYVFLAAYLPVIAGMGGNAGTQSMAVAVRGLVTHEININTAKQVLINEMEAGSVNGLVNGLIIAIVSYIFTQDEILSLVLFISMILSLINATFFGSFIPMIMKKIGKDPATSASIFITTTTDIVGFLTLLGLATILFG